jgi:hypothetical protein
MRYLKGSLSLSSRDQRLLQTVVEARYITHSQLFQLSRLQAVEFQRTVFNWRVRRLVTNGLLRKKVVPYLGADALYSITRDGIHALEERGVSLLAGFIAREKDPHEMQIPHVLELNRIRLALENSGALMYWVPESLIRVLNLSPVHRYAKTYDAVAKVRLDDNISPDFAIEYERTLKSEQKYDGILGALASERRLHTILYISPSFEILSTIRWHFRRARQQILFAQADDFKKRALDAQVDSASSYRRTTFRDALLRSASHDYTSVSA